MYSINKLYFSQLNSFYKVGRYINILCSTVKVETYKE